MESIFRYCTPPRQRTLPHSEDDLRQSMADCLQCSPKIIDPGTRAFLLSVPDSAKQSVKKRGVEGDFRDVLYAFSPNAFSSRKSCNEIPIIDLGDLKAASSQRTKTLPLEHVVSQLTGTRGMIIVLGAEEEIIVQAIQGIATKGQSLGIINIDSHLDFQRPQGNKVKSGFFRRLIDHDLSICDPMNFVELGAQPFLSTREEYEDVVQKGGTVFSLRDVRKESMGKILDLSYEITSRTTDHLAMVLDLDAIRVSEAPGSLQSMPTGLTVDDFLRAAYFAGRHRKTKLVIITWPHDSITDDHQMRKILALTTMNIFVGIAND